MYLKHKESENGNKISLSVLALKKETNEKIDRKIQTVKDREVANWQIGDYIFLEKPREDRE